MAALSRCAAFSEHVAAHPEVLVAPSSKTREELCGALKDVVDVMLARRAVVCDLPAAPLDELLVAGLDCDQIFEEIRLIHEPRVRWLQASFASLDERLDGEQDLDAGSAMGEAEGGESELSCMLDEFGRAEDDASVLEGEDASRDGEEEDSDCGMEADGDEGSGEDTDAGAPGEASVPGDDPFFDLNEFETFVAQELGDGDFDNRGTEDDVDFFVDPDELGDEASSDSDPASARYGKFFDPVGVKVFRGKAGQRRQQSQPQPQQQAGSSVLGVKRRRRPSDGGTAEAGDAGAVLADVFPEQEVDASEEDGEERARSRFELQQLRMQERIAKLEAKALEPKPWVLAGETRASDRAEAALLEEDLEFEHNAAPAPAISAETARTIESVLRQRIADGAFDDVVRKAAVQGEKRKAQVELDHNKSKRSLGDVYEDQFMKEAGLRAEAASAETREAAAVEDLFADICRDLDALSNFHYTPKELVPELAVVKNVPVVRMEEATPLLVSDAQLLTAEEVYQPKRRELRAADERTSEDRRAERANRKRLRAKQARARAAEERLVERVRPGMGNKHAKAKVLADIRAEGAATAATRTAATNVTKSTALFERLQADVRGQLDDYRREKGVAARKPAATGSRSAALKM